MKSNMKRIITFAMISMAFWLASCDNLSDLNIDPNNSSTARPKEVLTSATAYIAFIMDSQYNDNAYLWAQYLTWGTGVAVSNGARYVQLASYPNQAWARSYSDALADISFLKKSGHRGYKGMAKVLEAFVYQYLVDHFGDVPYSNAIKGAIEDGSVLAPSYDDDAVIYPQLVTTLTAAIADLEVALNDPAVIIGSEDLIYNGDLQQWIRFANSLKLRILMRMSDVVQVGDQVKELVAEQNFLESGSDIAQVAFSGDAGSENPMYAWNEYGIPYFYKAASTLTDVMNEFNDPRAYLLFKEAVNFPGEIRPAGQNQLPADFTAVSEDYSDVADVQYGPGVATIFMSPWEVWFLRAEAAVKFGTVDDATVAFTNAVTSHFDYLGASGADVFIPALGFEAGSTHDKINLIAVQKWISMAGLQEAEGWIETRRFNTPENPIFTGTEGIFQTPLNSSLADRVFPSRWVYPETEQTLNTNAPAQVTVTDKVFWDR